MRTEPSSAIVLEGVSAGYGSFEALHGVSLRVDQGSIATVIGPSGAGKSTLLKLSNSLVRVASGKLLVLGQDVRSLGNSELKKLRQKIAYIPQDLGLVEPVSVQENVLMGALPELKLPRVGAWSYPSRHRLRADSIMAELGIEGLSQKRVRDLSGGQRQRVAIGRALMQEASILIADEPVSSLDRGLADEVMKLFMSVSEKHGITLLMSLHQVELAEKYSDQIFGLRDGRLVLTSSGKLTEAQAAQLYGDSH